jgi:elongation factor Ts
MTTITAAQVKDLRERTGAGMMDCKKALQENGGDFEASIDWLRKKGLSQAAKKSGRTAAEGLVSALVTGTLGTVLELNSETDFVARNDNFQQFVATITKLAQANAVASLDALKVVAYPNTGRTIDEELTHMIATIGENMSLRRLQHVRVNQGVVTAYIHNSIADGLGKIAVLVALESTAPQEKLQDLGKKLAMHVAAAAPISLTTADVPDEILEREKAIFADQAKASGKPDNIIEKMVEGRVRKFYEESVLLEQTFVMDGETKIAAVVANAAKELGAPIALTGFARYALGEGIEKEEKNFAEEVAQQLAS